jgi:hypothetical protein
MEGTTKDNVIRFTQARLDKVKNLTFDRFQTIDYMDDKGIHHPKVDMYSIHSMDFIGHQFLEDSIFLREEKWLLDRHFFNKSGMYSTIPSHGEYLGTVKSFIKVDWKSATPDLWKAFQKFEDLYYDRIAPLSPDTNYILCGETAGIFTECGLLTHVLEFYSAEEKKKMRKLWNRYYSSSQQCKEM